MNIWIMSLTLLFSNLARCLQELLLNSYVYTFVGDLVFGHNSSKYFLIISVKFTTSNIKHL